MASLKREEEFKVNRARYENMQHGRPEGKGGYQPL